MISNKNINSVADVVSVVVILAPAAAVSTPLVDEDGLSYHAPLPDPTGAADDAHCLLCLLPPALHLPPAH